MARFFITYHLENDAKMPEEDQDCMEKWEAWAASLGEALVNPGSPVSDTVVLTRNGVSESPSPHPIMGFSILEAESMEAAQTLLKDCPHFEIDGTLEVSEIMGMAT